jgi:hypothetical protein
MNKEQVIVSLAEIQPKGFFRRNDILYRRLVPAAPRRNPASMPVLGPEYTLTYMTPNTVVRACDDEGHALHTKKEQKEHEKIATQSRDAYVDIRKRVHDIVSSQVGGLVHVFYSAYKSDANDVPIDNLDDVPVVGKVQFVQKSDEGNYKSEVAFSPTWLQICVFAEEMIRATGDYHHVFLENVRLDGHWEDVWVYKFSMGS